MDDERKASGQEERRESEQAPRRGAVPPDQAVPPAFEPGRQKSRGDGGESDDLQNDPAYEPEDEGLKGVKGG